MIVHVHATDCHFIFFVEMETQNNGSFCCKTVRSTRGRKLAVRSTQGQNRAVRSTQGGRDGGVTLMSGPQIWLSLYTFRPIALGLTTMASLS